MWLQNKQEALNLRDWASAFKEYPWLNCSDASLTSLRHPLAQSRIALISAGGSR
ncbi:hypothetical protein TPY_2306 [Sulfobacillus acidophilus TPY]|nr:hypothetical protein TPY_2306 [Sulfobacillus acidophilus TPY]